MIGECIDYEDKDFNIIVLWTKWNKVHDNNKLILIEFFKCDLKMTLLYFVRDGICFTPLLTQKQNLYT